MKAESSSSFIISKLDFNIIGGETYRFIGKASKDNIIQKLNKLIDFNNKQNIKSLRSLEEFISNVSSDEDIIDAYKTLNSYLKEITKEFKNKFKNNKVFLVSRINSNAGRYIYGSLESRYKPVLVLSIKNNLGDNNDIKIHIDIGIYDEETEEEYLLNNEEKHNLMSDMKDFVIDSFESKVRINNYSEVINKSDNNFMILDFNIKIPDLL